jgi:hypothetical protein
MKKNLLCLALFMTFPFALKAQTPAQGQIKRLPDGTPYREVRVTDDPTYPTYKHTGNTVEDEKRYQKEKAEWIEKNPEGYKKLTAGKPLTPEQEAEQQRKEELYRRSRSR